jgi:hypothetical protein
MGEEDVAAVLLLRLDVRFWIPPVWRLFFRAKITKFLTFLLKKNRENKQRKGRFRYIFSPQFCGFFFDLGHIVRSYSKRARCVERDVVSDYGME